MNVHEFSRAHAIYPVPSNSFGSSGVQNQPIAGKQYPDCSAGSLRVPNIQWGWGGVTIPPGPCSGNYFGKLCDGSGKEQGDCYWNDSHNTFSFTCAYGPVFDRLVCYTSMCGNQLVEGHPDVY